jgi:hypothetical protein
MKHHGDPFYIMRTLRIVKSNSELYSTRLLMPSRKIAPDKLKQTMRLIPDPPNVYHPKPIINTSLADFDHVLEDDTLQESLDPDEDTLVNSGIFDYPDAPKVNSARNMPPDSETDIQRPFG